jgi:hypothetical protein
VNYTIPPRGFGTANQAEEGAREGPETYSRTAAAAQGLVGGGLGRPNHELGSASARAQGDGRRRARFASARPCPTRCLGPHGAAEHCSSDQTPCPRLNR